MQVCYELEDRHAIGVKVGVVRAHACCIKILVRRGVPSVCAIHEELLELFPGFGPV